MQRTRRASQHNGILAMQTAHLSTKAHVALSCSANSLPPRTHGWPSCCVNPSSRSHMLSDKQHLVETMRLNWFYWFPATENPLGIWGHKGPEWRFQILIPRWAHRKDGGGGDKQTNYWRSRAFVTCKANWVNGNWNLVYCTFVTAKSLPICHCCVRCNKIRYHCTILHPFVLQI